jgi:hypothetical protein
MSQPLVLLLILLPQSFNLASHAFLSVNREGVAFRDASLAFCIHNLLLELKRSFEGRRTHICPAMYPGHFPSSNTCNAALLFGRRSFFPRLSSTSNYARYIRRHPSLTMHTTYVHPQIFIPREPGPTTPPTILERAQVGCRRSSVHLVDFALVPQQAARVGKSLEFSAARYETFIGAVVLVHVLT